MFGFAAKIFGHCLSILYKAKKPWTIINVWTSSICIYNTNFKAAYIYEFRSKTNSRKWHTGNSYSTVCGVVSLEYGVNTKVPHESWLKKSLKEKKPNRLHKNAQVNEPSLNPVHNGSQSDEQIMATGDCNTRLLYLYKIIYIYTHLCTHTHTH